MVKSHHKDGELQLFSYNLAKSPEFSNPLNVTSEPTGNTIYTIMEVYKNPAGLQDHWTQGQESWADFGALMKWAGSVKFSVMHGSPVLYSLW